MSKFGNLYVFEGADGVGKSFLSQEFAKHLKSWGVNYQYFSFPGKENGTLGELVYNIHHSPKDYFKFDLSPISIQLLHVAAHIDAIEKQILPAIKSGHTVILDRFWWSTKVYGLESGISPKMLDSVIKLENKVWGKIRPTILFLINRDAPLRPEPQEKWQKWLSLYKTLTQQETTKYPIHLIDNNGLWEDALNKVITSFNENSVTKPIKQKQLSLTFGGTVNSTLRQYTFSSIFSAKPTIVFDTYWRFATERQNIFFKRIQGENLPWTNDPILREYKFTNAYRASDRVSQYLIKNVIYKGEQTPVEIFFRTILFKLFNKIETWELLTKSHGSIRYETYNFNDYDAVLSNAINNKQAIYSAAYIMPSGSKILGSTRKHRTHLKLLEQIMEDETASKISDTKNMFEAFKLLRSYPMIGDFLAYQYVTDLNYSTLTDFSEVEFVVPGPGAKGGIHKCFQSLGNRSEIDIIKMVADRQETEFERLGLNFLPLWGRPLQLIDCQNLFCEVDKYARIKHPDITGISQRTRIKQKFAKTTKVIDYWYPPKWGINEKIKEEDLNYEPRGIPIESSRNGSNAARH